MLSVLTGQVRPDVCLPRLDSNLTCDVAVVGAASVAWAGTFAESSDGLAPFGARPQCGPRVLFAMAYGGNGITYSMLGAGLLRAQIERRSHPLTKLFPLPGLDFIKERFNDC